MLPAMCVVILLSLRASCVARGDRRARVAAGIGGREGDGAGWRGGRQARGRVPACLLVLAPMRGCTLVCEAELARVPCMGGRDEAIPH